MIKVEHEEARKDLKWLNPIYLNDKDISCIERLGSYINQQETKDRLLDAITVHPETLNQLESLIENAKSFIDEKDEDKDDVWHKDIEVLTSTIEVIKALLEIKGVNPEDLGKPPKRPDLFDVMEDEL